MSSDSSESSVEERFVGPPVDPEVLRRAAEAFLDPRRDSARVETTSDLPSALADPDPEVRRGRSQTSRPRNNDDRSRSPRAGAPTRENRYRSPDGLQSRREQHTDDRDAGRSNQGVEDMDKDGLLEMIKKLQEEVEVFQKQGKAKHILDRELADAERIRSLEAELEEVRAGSLEEPSEDGGVRENPESNHESAEGSTIAMTDLELMHKLAFEVMRCWAFSLNPSMEMDEDFRNYDEKAIRNLGQRSIVQHEKVNDEIIKLKDDLEVSQQVHDDKSDECRDLWRRLRQDEIAYNERLEEKDEEIRELRAQLQHAQDDSKKQAEAVERDGKKRDKEIRSLRAILAGHGDTDDGGSRREAKVGAKGKSQKGAKAKSGASAVASGSGAGTIARTTKATKAVVPGPSAAGPVGVQKGTRNPPRSARFVGKYNLG